MSTHLEQPHGDLQVRFPVVQQRRRACLRGRISGRQYEVKICGFAFPIAETTSDAEGLHVR